MPLRRDLAAAQIDDMVARAGSGAVKDSYADLDLVTRGFEILFRAQWIRREPSAGAALGPDWRVVASAGELEEWWAAHGSTGVFTAGLLRHEAVRFLAAQRGGRIVAGAIAHHSARVVGISNAFWTDEPAATRWAGLSDVVGACSRGSRSSVTSRATSWPRRRRPVSSRPDRCGSGVGGDVCGAPELGRIGSRGRAGRVPRWGRG